MLQSIFDLISGVFLSLWGLVATLLTFAWDLLVWLHVESPRLEGLLLGVLLAWLLARRDSHPLLRVLSAPLKLVLDILDLAWDQVCESAIDLWDTAKSWTGGSVSWITGKLKSGYDAVMGKLKSTKTSLEDEK